MQYTTEQIAKYSKEFRIYKGKVESGLATDSICQDVERLEKSISVLPENDYHIIRLLFFENKSYAEVARRFGYSKTGMYKRVKVVEKAIASIMSD